LLARQDLDEGAERHDARHATGIDTAHLDVAGERPDDVDRLLSPLRAGRADEHGAVVLDVDGALRLLDDLANHLAARADHVANAIGRNLDLRDAWRVRR